MATKLYLNNVAPSFTPTTVRGAWDDTAALVTKSINPDKLVGNTITAVSRSETTATADWDVLLFRGVSPKLEAQTISGTLDVLLGANESSLSADDVFHVHVYVTQGDTDTVRGTLLSNYVDPIGNEWAINQSIAGRALNAAQTLTNVAVSQGDRIVVELGYTAKNTATTSFNASLFYGGDTTTSDMTAGGNAGTQSGFITFSADIAFVPQNAQISQIASELAILATDQQPAQVSQIAVEIGIPATTQQTADIAQIVVEIPVVNFVPGSFETGSVVSGSISIVGKTVIGTVTPPVIGTVTSDTIPITGQTVTASETPDEVGFVELGFMSIFGGLMMAELTPEEIGSVESDVIDIEGQIVTGTANRRRPHCADIFAQVTKGIETSSVTKGATQIGVTYGTMSVEFSGGQIILQQTRGELDILEGCE